MRKLLTRLLLALALTAAATPAARADYETALGVDLTGTFRAKTVVCVPPGQISGLTWELDMTGGFHVKYAGAQSVQQGNLDVALHLHGTYLGVHGYAFGTDVGGTYTVNGRTWQLTVNAFEWHGSTVAVEGTVDGGTGTFTAGAQLTEEVPLRWCVDDMRQWDAHGVMQAQSA